MPIAIAIPHTEWSLVAYTLTAQTAIGLAVASLFAPNKRFPRCPYGIAVLLMIGAAILSLFHLGTPQHAMFTLNNLFHSWLSREILFTGLFGASALLAAIKPRLPFRALAAVVGLAFIAVMGFVYIMPTAVAWNSWVTTASFLATALTLGGLCCALIVGACGGEGAPGLLAKAVIVAFVGFGLQCALAVLQGSLIAQTDISLSWVGVRFAVSFIGVIFLGVVLLIRRGSIDRIPWAILALIVALGGEVIGRAIFYMARTNFGL